MISQAGVATQTSWAQGLTRQVGGGIDTRVTMLFILCQGRGWAVIHSYFKDSFGGVTCKLSCTLAVFNIGPRD